MTFGDAPYCREIAGRDRAGKGMTAVRNVGGARRSRRSIDALCMAAIAGKVDGSARTWGCFVVSPKFLDVGERDAAEVALSTSVPIFTLDNLQMM